MRDVVEIGLGKTAQRGYHLDDVAIVPTRRTRDVDDVSTAWQLDAYPFRIPCVAHPSDATMSPATAIALGRWIRSIPKRSRLAFGMPSVSPPWPAHTYTPLGET